MVCRGLILFSATIFCLALVSQTGRGEEPDPSKDQKHVRAKNQKKTQAATGEVPQKQHHHRHTYQKKHQNAAQKGTPPVAFVDRNRDGVCDRHQKQNKATKRWSKKNRAAKHGAQSIQRSRRQGKPNTGTQSVKGMK